MSHYVCSIWKPSQPVHTLRRIHVDLNVYMDIL